MRIVQDSEDEEDLEVEVFEDASHDEPSPQIVERGTGSTESLKRTIEDAHRAQFQSPADACAHPQDALHSMTLGNKRNKTPLDPSSLQMESTRQDSSPNNESIISTTDLPGIEHLAGETTAQPTLLSPEKAWDLQGTMREEWQYHEPGIFPEPSSTVPNATATQQRLLQDIIAPNFLGVEAGAFAPYQPPKSSIPWSEYLRSSSSKGPQEELVATGHSEQLSAEHYQDLATPDDPFNVTTLGNSPTLVPLSQSPQRSRDESELHRRSSVSQKDMPHVDLGNNEAATLPMSPTRNTIAAACPNGSLTPSRLMPGIATHMDPVQTRKSPRQPQKPHAESASTAPITKTRQRPNPTSGYQDDSIVVEIPKEQYVPRPSRSRSANLSLEAPIDYSVRPEKAALRARRTRTSSALEKGSATTTPEKVRQICDMGFSPSATQRALKRHHGDVASSVEWLTASRPEDEDELAPPRSLKPKKNGKGNGAEKPLHSATEEYAQGASINAPDEVGTAPIGDAEQDPSANSLGEPAVVLPSKSPRVKVVIPNKSKGHESPSQVRAEQPIFTETAESDDLEASRKAKRRKIATEQAESLTEDAPDSPVVVPAPVKEKKKRGRPRKEPAAEQRQVDELPTNSEDARIALQEVEPNAQLASEELESSEKQPNQPAEQTPTSEDMEDASKNASSELLSTEKPCKESLGQSSEPSVSNPRKPLASTVTTRSPQVKGKVSYRVGLSKRARIAPLLRVVKK